MTLESTDCITKLNVAFDRFGNGHSIIYRRREADKVETEGYDSVTSVALAYDDIPAAGCLSGYQLGFAAVAE